MNDKDMLGLLLTEEKKVQVKGEVQEKVHGLPQSKFEF